MKPGWNLVRLEEICDFGNGLWTGKKPPFINVGVVRNTNFTKDGELDDSAIVYLKVEQSQFAKRKLKYGDIILEKSGGGPKQPVGRVIVFNKREGNYSFSNFTSVIRIKNFNQVDFKYLHRFLFFSYISGLTETMQSHSTGIRNLRFDKYKKIQIPLPPLPEQKRIVSILDEAFAAITNAKSNAEQNLNNAKGLFDSYLWSVLAKKRDGWIECNLEDNIRLIDYRGRTPQKTKSGVRLITAKNVKLGYLQLEPQEFIAENYYESWMTRGIPKYGDVLFTTEAPLANIAQIDTTEKLAFAQRIIVMQPNPKILNQTFLKYLLLSPPIRNKIISNGTGATVLGIKSRLLKKIGIYFPSSIKEQQTIVHQLDVLRAETQKLVVVYQKKIDDLEELKRSLLQKAFAGELITNNSTPI